MSRFSGYVSYEFSWQKIKRAFLIFPVKAKDKKLDIKLCQQNRVSTKKSTPGQEIPEVLLHFFLFNLPCSSLSIQIARIIPEKLIQAVEFLLYQALVTKIPPARGDTAHLTIMILHTFFSCNLSKMAGSSKNRTITY